MVATSFIIYMDLVFWDVLWVQRSTVHSPDGLERADVGAVDRSVGWIPCRVAERTKQGNACLLTNDCIKLIVSGGEAESEIQFYDTLVRTSMKLLSNSARLQRNRHLPNRITGYWECCVFRRYRILIYARKLANLTETCMGFIRHPGLDGFLQPIFLNLTLTIILLSLTNNVSRLKALSAHIISMTHPTYQVAILRCSNILMVRRRMRQHCIMRMHLKTRTKRHSYGIHTVWR
jgi:hypothetical protein